MLYDYFDEEENYEEDFLEENLYEEDEENYPTAEEYNRIYKQRYDY